jgi:hypothetical protein
MAEEAELQAVAIELNWEIAHFCLVTICKKMR